VYFYLSAPPDKLLFSWIDAFQFQNNRFLTFDFPIFSTFRHQSKKKSNHKHPSQQIKIHTLARAAANALGKFSWGNLPFPQTPMDAIFFERMPQNPIPKENPSKAFSQKKQLRFSPYPNDL
jgi:hypothetical protein